VQELFPLLTQLLALFSGNLGPAAAIGTGVLLILRIYRTSALQALLPKRARWDSLHPYAKVGLPFAVSFVGSLLLSLAGGATVLSSLPAALMAALGAIGIHHATKAMGQAETNSQLKALGPSYTPSPLRNAVSIIVPIGKVPQDLFEKTP
jgi:hypothetical protein